MARIVQRRMYWDAPPDTDLVAYEIYVGDPSVADFLAQIDAGQVQPHATVSAPEGEQPATEYYLASLPEGNYQLAVAALDDDGNYSDPYQHPAWADVPLDVTPPAAPSGGGLD